MNKLELIVNIIIFILFGVNIYLGSRNICSAITKARIYQKTCNRYRFFIQIAATSCGYTKEQAYDITNFIEAGNYQGINTTINNPNWFEEALEKYRKD